MAPVAGGFGPLADVGVVVPSITSESWKFGCSRLAGIDCEPQLKNGIAPWERMSFHRVGGEGVVVAGAAVQLAKGEEKLISEAPLPAICSKLVTALMSQGASVPVSWLPIQAPQ